MSTLSLHDARAHARDIITRFDGGEIYGGIAPSDDGHGLHRDVVIDGHTYSLWVYIWAGADLHHSVTLYDVTPEGMKTIVVVHFRSMSPGAIEKIIRTATTDYQERTHAHQ